MVDEQTLQLCVLRKFHRIGDAHAQITSDKRSFKKGPNVRDDQITFRHSTLSSWKSGCSFKAIYFFKLFTFDFNISMFIVPAKFNGQYLTAAPLLGFPKFLCWLVIYLDGRFARDMGNQEIHGNIFTIHVLIYFVSDNLWHPVKVQICKVLYKGEKNKQ